MVTTYYQVFNKDDMKKFLKFPDHYYDYLNLSDSYYRDDHFL